MENLQTNRDVGDFQGDALDSADESGAISAREAQALYSKENTIEQERHGASPKPASYTFGAQTTSPTGPEIGDGTPMHLEPICKIERGGATWHTAVGWPALFEYKAQFNSLDEEAAGMLTAVVRAIKPRICLETGTHRGRSTRAIVDGLCHNGDGHLWTLDRSDHKIFESGAIPPHAQSRITRVFGSSPEALDGPSLSVVKGVDFAFLDSVHSAEGVLAEIEWLKVHMADTCTVLVDNAYDDGWPGLKALFADYEDYNHALLPTLNGMELIQMVRR